MENENVTIDTGNGMRPLTQEELEAILAANPGAETVYVTEDMEEPKEETPTVH